MTPCSSASVFNPSITSRSMQKNQNSNFQFSFDRRLKINNRHSIDCFQLPNQSSSNLQFYSSSFTSRTFFHKFQKKCDFEYGFKWSARNISVHAGTGFGETDKKVKKVKGKNNFEKTKPDIEPVCNCGGGEEGLPYSSCCARFHGGVIEPNATSLLKARYCAFTKGVIPYLIRTTHPDNPDISRPDGKTTLEKDCKATCDRLLFKKLEIKSVENGDSEDETFISFRVTYAYREGPDRQDKYLIEKSRFLKLENRWLYREKIDIDLASSMEWNNGMWLYESPEAGKQTFSNSWANSKLRLRK